MNDEIKSWRTKSSMVQIARLLMIDGIQFCYNVEDGIVFSAPQSYVKAMVNRMVACYVCKSKPIIEEY